MSPSAAVGTADGPALTLTVHGQPAWLDRFWAKVDRSGDGCWEWQAARDKDGYGLFWLDGRMVRAHRIAWAIAHPGEDLHPDVLVRHHCDNPPCVRARDLTTGTVRDNAFDAMQRGRLAVGDQNGARLHPERILRGSASPTYRPDTCRNGHPLSRRYVSPSGERICTDCATERTRRYRAKARAEGRRV